VESFPGGFFCHGAVLERGEVPVDGCLLLLDLGQHGGVLGAALGVAVTVALPRSGDGVGDQVSVAGVEGDQRVQDGGVEGVGEEALGVAAVGAIAAAGEAGVVPVDAVAAGGGGADELVSACRAGDQPGQVVVADAHRPLGAGVGPAGGDLTRLAPGLAADQRLVGVLDVDVAVGDVAGVGGVGDDPV
jgi:hypothetical protein